MRGCLSLHIRIVKDINSLLSANSNQQLAIIVSGWIAAANALKDNCLFDLADFLVLSVVGTHWHEFRSTPGYPSDTEHDVQEIARLLAAIPPRHLEYMDQHRGQLPTISETIKELSDMMGQQAKFAFTEGICMTYFRKQSRLQTGNDLTEIASKELTVPHTNVCTV